MVIWGRSMGKSFSIAEAKAHFSQLTERAATGETVLITRRGQPIARMSPPEQARRPVDPARLRRLTDAIARQSEDAAAFTHRMREGDRY